MGNEVVGWNVTPGDKASGQNKARRIHRLGIYFVKICKTARSREMFNRNLSPIPVFVLLLAFSANSVRSATIPSPQDSTDSNTNQSIATDTKLVFWTRPPAAKKHTLTEEELKQIQSQNSATSQDLGKQIHGRSFLGAFTAAMAAGTVAILIHIFYVPFAGRSRSRRRQDKNFELAQTANTFKRKDS